MYSRQIPGQALDFHLVEVVLDDAAAGLHARRDVGVLEVQRHVHAQQLVGLHAQEIGVRGIAADRVALQILEHDLLLAAGEIERQQVRVEGLDRQMLAHLVGGDGDGDRLIGTAVNDRRDLARATQAAARTLALVLTRFGVDDEILFH
jgi:hypothetical protein